MNELNRIAAKYFPDYPNIETESTGGCLHCIETGIEGILAANNDLHEKIAFLKRNHIELINKNTKLFIVPNEKADLALNRNRITSFCKGMCYSGGIKKNSIEINYNEGDDVVKTTLWLYDDEEQRNIDFNELAKT